MQPTLDPSRVLRSQMRSGAVRSISAFTVRMRGVDWVALAILVLEIPSLLLSQDRANSVAASEVVALSVLVYFTLRLLLSSPLRIMWLAVLMGLDGVSLALIGIHQFSTATEQLTAVSLTDLLAEGQRG